MFEGIAHVIVSLAFLAVIVGLFVGDDLYILIALWIMTRRRSRKK